MSKKNPAKKTPAKKNATSAREQPAPAETVTPETAARETAPVNQPATEPVDAIASGEVAKANATPKGKRAKKEKAAPTPKKLSAIDAAAALLAQAGQAMTCHEMVEAMAKKGLWTTPGGQTPHATLYSAILREIAKKGKESRFTKTERGKFAAV